jgi:hypothetical protein
MVRTVVVVVSAALLLWAIILSKRESEHSISDPEPQPVR